MQDRIGAISHPFDPHLTSRRMQQGEHFGSAVADVLMWLPNGFPFGLPATARIGDGLIWPCLILIPHRQSQAFSLLMRAFNQFFFATVSTSLTVTTPLLRLRLTVPVSHQVRLFCQL